MKKFGYRPAACCEDIGWTTVATHGIIRVPIALLRATIMTAAGRQRRRIQETPHFQWIASLVRGQEDLEARRSYHRYVATFMPELDADETVENVVRLVESIRASGYADGDLTVITGKPRRQYGLGPYILKIYDGVHRSSCALALGHRYIQCRIK